MKRIELMINWKEHATKNHAYKYLEHDIDIRWAAAYFKTRHIRWEKKKTVEWQNYQSQEEINIVWQSHYFSRYKIPWPQELQNDKLV